MTISEPGFVDRATATGRRLVGRGESVVRRVIGQRSRPEAEAPPAADMRTLIRACLNPSAGEMSARQHAVRIRAEYEQLDAAGQRAFFDLLATEFSLDRLAVDARIKDRDHVLAESAVDTAELLRAERALRDALSPPRELLFTRLNALEAGVKFVVDLRADLRSIGSSDPEFRAMDIELKRLLATWFDVGNLELRQITWDTPASLLEKLIAYEAVHAIGSWNDLRNRLDADRRCFAFFHPGMPDEPLIFVEVALVQGLAGDLSALLDVDAPILDPQEADTAIFYSISNCQDGLAGVSLGNALIKRVVGKLSRNLPQLKTFSTLSPIPGFRSWLVGELASKGDSVFGLAELPGLRLALQEHGVDGVPVTPEGMAGKDTTLVGTTVADALPTILDRADWPENEHLAAALRGPLLRLAGRYLTEAKRGLRVADRVANFHLSNGARLEQLNWMGNAGSVGLDRAAGMMVNYRYVPDEIDQNHEAYLRAGTVRTSGQVAKLIAG